MFGIPTKIDHRFLLPVMFGVLFFWNHSVLVARAATVYMPNVIGLYHFNNQNENDSSTYARNGTDCATAMTYTSTSSKLGAYAASTGGGAGCFSVPSSTMDLSGDFTIGTWINPQETLTGKTVYLIAKSANGDGTATEGIVYDALCVANNIEYVHHGTCKIDTAYTFATSTWYWILLERHGSSTDLYVNDSSTPANGTDGLSSNASPSVYFNSVWNGTGGQKMFIDETFFANSAINTSTRDSLWNSGTGAEVCVTAGCDGSGVPTLLVTTSSLIQYKSDGTTVIGAGSSTVENSVKLTATLETSGAATSTLKLQLEVQPSSTAFTNNPTAAGTVFVQSGSSSTVTVSGLGNGAYHWQARAIDQNNNTSTWRLFGANATGTDFVVQQPTVYVPNITSLYHFDGNLTDSSGNGYNRTVVTSGETYPAGKLGSGAMDTNGASRSSSVSSTLDESGDFTIGYWLNTSSTDWTAADGPYVFAKFINMGNSTGIGYSIWCTAHHQEFIHNSNVTCPINIAESYATSTWYWILFERHGSALDFYVNDSLAQTATDSSNNKMNSLWYLDGDSGGNFRKEFVIDELFTANAAIATSTRDSLYNNGKGAQVCANVGCGSVNISSGTLQQYRADATTPLGEGSSTPDNAVVFGAAVSSAVTSTVRLDVEWQPAGTAFTNTANASSGYVTTGQQATTSVPFNLNHSYHWQARAVDKTGLASPWQLFGSSTSAIDFRVLSLNNAASEYFDGSSSLSYSASNVTFAATDSSTIEFWYRTNNTSTLQKFIDTRQSSSSSFNKGYFVDWNWNGLSSAIHFFMGCATGTIDFNAATSSALIGNPSDVGGIWHHVAITKSSSNASSAFNLYFDGVSKPLDWSGGSQGPISGNCFTVSSTDSIFFGQAATSTPNYLIGNLDEIRVWNTERSSSSIAAYWNKELNFSDVNLKGLWQFNSSTLDIATGHAASSTGSPITASSTPFGHFWFQNNQNAVGQYASVNINTRQLLWRYDLNAGDSDYTSAITTSTAAWNTLGQITLASTTATSSMTLQILDKTNATDTLWFGHPAVWVSQYTNPTSTVDHIYLNSYYLDGNADSYPAVPYSDAAKAEVIMHELGHSLGLDHSYSPNIMKYAGDRWNPQPILGSQDKSDYYFIWGGGD
jgi:hypothetical protein